MRLKFDIDLPLQVDLTVSLDFIRLIAVL